jgi:putative membrane protein
MPQNSRINLSPAGLVLPVLRLCRPDFAGFKLQEAACLSWTNGAAFAHLTVVGLPQLILARRMKAFLKRSVITGFAVILAAKIVPGITYSTEGLILATLLLGILNAFVRPIMVVLTLPLLIFTLGLFILVINALLLWGVGRILGGEFTVESFGSAFWGSLIISIVSLVLNSITKSGDSRINFQQGKPPPRPPKDDGGPVIDI